MILIDTGYLIAVLRPADALHLRAVAWSQTLKEPLIVTDQVLVETVNQLSSPAERPAAHQMIAEIRSDATCRIVSTTPELLEAGLRLHADRPDKAWSLTDCISFHVMGEHQVTRALAYDHHFEQAGFDPLLRRDPG